MISSVMGPYRGERASFYFCVSDIANAWLERQVFNLKPSSAKRYESWRLYRALNWGAFTATNLRRRWLSAFMTR